MGDWAGPKVRGEPAWVAFVFFVFFFFDNEDCKVWGKESGHAKIMNSFNGRDDSGNVNHDSCSEQPWG